MTAIMQVHSSPIIAPTGMLMMISGSTSIPAGWSYFSGANNYWVMGTTSDTNVGTIVGRSVPSYGTGAGGSHSTGGTLQSISKKGYYQNDTSGSSYNPSRDYNSYGNHAHTATIYYHPKRQTTKFVQAAAGAIIQPGLIGLADAALTGHTQWNYHNSYSGYLGFGSSEGQNSWSPTAGVSSVSVSHDHLLAVKWKALGIVSNPPTTQAAGLGSHSHTFTPTISENLYKAVYRAYTIVNALGITGIIGFWPYTGAIPTGWTLLTNPNNRHIRITSTGNGAGSGAGTISISGTSSTVNHSHPTSGTYSGSVIVSGIQHTSNIGHSHSMANTKAYSAQRYYLKLIKYTG